MPGAATGPTPRPSPAPGVREDSGNHGAYGLGSLRLLTPEGPSEPEGSARPPASRSSPGTIAQVLTALVGRQNTCAPISGNAASRRSGRAPLLPRGFPQALTRAEPLRVPHWAYRASGTIVERSFGRFDLGRSRSK